MRGLRWLLCVVMLAVFPATLGWADDASKDQWGNIPWPAEQGAPAGYPGAFDELGEDGKPLYPVWGNPELQNYPGSIEHYRHREIKYLPAINPFNATTLVRNWKVGDIDGLATEPYASPIYYVPMYSPPKFTGRFREPVAVHRLRPDGGTRGDGGTAIRLTLGKLPRGMYAVRMIAAIESESRNWAGDPATLVIRCTINDGPDGKFQNFVRRHRSVDEFYAVGEWYFHVVDDRSYEVEFALDGESKVDLLVHNIDLHDVLAGIPEKPIKTRSTVFTRESREAAQAYYAEHSKTNRNWGPNIQLPREPGLWTGEPLDTDARRARDRVLWYADPPQAMNFQEAGLYGKYDQGAPDAAQVAEIGTWVVPFDTRNHRNWDRARVMANEKLGLQYTLDDFLQLKPLPAPYPYGDRGWGVKIEGKGYFHPVMSQIVNRSATYQLLGHQQGGTLPIEYFNRNNLHAARDAALILIREAYTLPSHATYQKRWLQQVVSRADQTFGFNDPMLRRATGSRIAAIAHMTRVYDMLFDYIKDNQELAAAVNEFIPWIHTSADLQAFLDQRILGWGMRMAMQHRVGSSHGTASMLILMATVAEEPNATRPLMEFLFSQMWDYPLPLSGIQDYMVTGTTRDGTTTIGSFSYTAGGSPFLEVADGIATYIANGGDRKFNLADPQRYPKPFAAAYFNLEARVAGLWPVGVGDVGGMMRYGQWFESQEAAVRIGVRYINDPRLAYILFHHFGRKDETDAQWEAIGKAASTVTRDPWMANQSRVLSNWAGILESGLQHDDPRFRRAATVRVGIGWGHSHRDTLDLQLFAMGVQATPDGGQRPGYGRPDAIMTMNHNLVEVDGDASKDAGNWEGHAWVGTLAEMRDSPMLRARAVPPQNKQQVTLAERTVALLTVDEGRPSTRVASDRHLKPTTVFGTDAVLPRSYAFDVYRVAGGKRHTHIFHGMPEDQFTVNAINPRAVPLPANAQPDDTDAKYLRRFILEGYQGAGQAPATVIATWRMGREQFDFEAVSGRTDEGRTVSYKSPAPEPLMMGANYDRTAPRKYVRMHLLGQEGARLMWGRWVSAPYGGTQGQWFTQLFTQHDGPDDREGVFPAVIEMFAGEPAIATTDLLNIRDNESDARRAVAVKVVTVHGHEDFLFSDGRPDRTRVIDAGPQTVTASGEYAYISTDRRGLRQASLVAGQTLEKPGVVIIQPQTAAYTGTIKTIDHLRRSFTLDSDLPGELIGHAVWEVGNDQHRTSLEIPKVRGRKLDFRKGLELVSTRVVSVDRQAGEVVGRLVSILMGAEEDNGMKPGMTSGLWASNEDLTKWWQCEYTGGSRDNGYTYKLTGSPIGENDFPVGGTLRIWELGPGDQARLATRVNLRRNERHPDRYELSANVACRIALPATAAGYEHSADGLTWEPIPTESRDGMLWLTFTPETLQNGERHLRPTQH